MTVKDFKELFAYYPDDMPVELVTFRGINEEGWVPPDELIIEDVSIDKRYSIEKSANYKVLKILVG